MDLVYLNHWRAVVTDTSEGIVVLDVVADNEAEAKGTAHSSAATHLKCRNITNCIVMRHVDMPTEWLRMKQTSKFH